MDEETREKLKKLKELFRELISELNGKTMDYETCRMLEEFLNTYTEVMLKSIEQELLKIKEKYDLVPKSGETRT